MREQWEQIERILRTYNCLDQVGLRQGASDDKIAALESHLGVNFPDSLRTFLAIHDGQDGRAGLGGGEQLLSAEQIQREWDVWRSLDEVAIQDAIAGGDAVLDIRKNDRRCVTPAGVAWRR